MTDLFGRYRPPHWTLWRPVQSPSPVIQPADSWPFHYRPAVSPSHWCSCIASPRLYSGIRKPPRVSGPASCVINSVSWLWSGCGVSTHGRLISVMTALQAFLRSDRCMDHEQVYFVFHRITRRAQIRLVRAPLYLLTRISRLPACNIFFGNPDKCSFMGEKTPPSAGTSFSPLLFTNTHKLASCVQFFF